MALVVASALLTGCISVQTEEPVGSASEAPDEAPDGDPRMTAEEQVDRERGQDQETPPFYDRQIVNVTGEVSLAVLGAELSTVDGDVTVTTGKGTGWRLVAVLEGRGYTADEAARQRERLSFDWDIGSAADRHLSAEVQKANQPTDSLLTTGSATGEITLVLPENQFVEMALSTTDGDIRLDGLRAGALSLSTTDGDIDVGATTARVVAAETTDGDVDVDLESLEVASISTTDGDVTATLKPGSSGAFTVETTDGAIDLRVPEDGTRGYDLLAESSEGEVEVRLEDGSTRSTGGEEEGEEVRFLTRGFQDRAIQTRVELHANGGDIVVSPT